MRKGVVLRLGANAARRPSLRAEAVKVFMDMDDGRVALLSTLAWTGRARAKARAPRPETSPWSF